MNFKKNTQGYIFLKPFNKIYLPTYVQNILIKNFCDQKNLLFNLSANEQNIDNCWMELFSIVKKKDIQVIVMTSIHMLPNNKKDFSKFCQILNKNKKEFFFIFENTLCKNLSELKILKNKFNLIKKLDKIF
jgi:sporadic carbohydrate cluster protein (TIGR04323 family)